MRDQIGLPSAHLGVIFSRVGVGGGGGGKAVGVRGIEH